MANDDDVRRLVEQILPNFKPCLVLNSAEIVIPDSFIPSGHITKEFLSIFKIVLSIKQKIVYKRWEKFCAISMLNALSSHEIYLRYIMFACDIEIGISDNIFGQFINVCALVITFIEETVNATEINFTDLAVEIFMVFYQSALKASFCEQGDFKRFSEYVRNAYIFWCSYFRDKGDVEHGLSLLTNTFENLEKKGYYGLEFNTHKDVMNSKQCLVLAKTILSNTKLKFPSLPSSGVLMARIRANREKRTATSGKKAKIIADTSKVKKPSENSKCETPRYNSKIEMQVNGKKTEVHTDDSTNDTPVCDSKSEPTKDDSKSEKERKIFNPFLNLPINDLTEQNTNIVWCKNIVQLVMKYNASKQSDPPEANYGIQKEADKILQCLTEKITVLIGNLDQYDEE